LYKNQNLASLLTVSSAQEQKHVSTRSAHWEASMGPYGEAVHGLKSNLDVKGSVSRL